MRTLLAAAPLSVGDIELSEAESFHGRSVLRLTVGDKVRLADGAGRIASAEVCAMGRHQLSCRVDAVETPAAAPCYQLTVALAAPKGSRLDDCVRALVELGVGGITFLGTERGARMPADERLQRIAGEALKQCRGTILPRLQVVESLALWQPTGQLVILDPDGGPAQPGRPQVTTLIIGPEGGLSVDEDARLRGLGAQSVSIASTILRIETAAIAAAALWAHHWHHHGAL